MKEREFQGWVLDVAARFGWRAWHVPAPMRPIGGGKLVPETRAAGLPDLILFHEDPARLIFAELKDPKGVLSAEQAEFLRLASLVREQTRGDDGDRNLLLRYGVPIGVYVWRPGDEDQVETILRSRVMA